MRNNRKKNELLVNAKYGRFLFVGRSASIYSYIFQKKVNEDTYNEGQYLRNQGYILIEAAEHFY